MATLQAATTSIGAIVTDTEAVRQLCEAHCSGTLHWEIDEEGEVIIWEYDAFEIYETREDGLPDYEGGLITHAFLRKLANSLKLGEELDIQTAGYTKCQLPVLAKRCVIREGDILYADLSGLGLIEESQLNTLE
ncbi:hypothetical protein [Haloprofundus halobius]|uniref:hypothetical protein n=1 Tax=Haloprofundus halobius TaxID=2876194 RepID=UPI001CCCAD92|nr:hypothetical protein [Haloprofundus halobius]